MSQEPNEPGTGAHVHGEPHSDANIYVVLWSVIPVRAQETLSCFHFHVRTPLPFTLLGIHVTLASLNPVNQSDQISRLITTVIQWVSLACTYKQWLSGVKP